MEIRNISPKTINLFKECFDANGSPKKIENIDWQFLKAPVNKQYVDIAIDQENVAAIYAVFPTKFKIGSGNAIGVQSLDTITAVDYRGKGLFIRLAGSVYDKAINDKVELVYGFPNGNSIHGFSKKLGWKVLDPVPFLIRPLKTSYFTSKFKWLSWLPNINLRIEKHKESAFYSITLVSKFDECVDDIWNNFSTEIYVAINRSKEYLEWRYIQKPNENYHIAECSDIDGTVNGYIIYTVKEKHGGRIGYIMELIYNLEDSQIGKQLVSFALNEFKKKNADCVLAWSFEHSPNFNSFKKNRFFTMPEKMRPIELHFGVRSFNPDNQELIENRKNWFISYSDSDTV